MPWLVSSMRQTAISIVRLLRTARACWQPWWSETVQGGGNRQGATGIGQRAESAVLARIAWKRPSTFAFRRSRPELAVGCGHRYDPAQPPLRPRGPIDQRASEDDTSNSHDCFGPLGAIASTRNTADPKYRFTGYGPCVSSSAAATMGLAQAGVEVKSDGPTMRPRSMCSTKTGCGACPAAGSAVAELSYTRSSVSTGSNFTRLIRLWR